MAFDGASGPITDARSIVGTFHEGVGMFSILERVIVSPPGDSAYPGGTKVPGLIYPNDPGI